MELQAEYWVLLPGYYFFSPFLKYKMISAAKCISNFYFLGENEDGQG